MHISDGIINWQICLAADVLTIAAIHFSSKKIEAQEIPKMGMTAAALFAASLIHLPIGGASLHLGLFGIAGIILKKRAFPVVFTALLFQSLIFQHGGLITIGVNTFNMASGAYAGWLIWELSFNTIIKSFLSGFFGIIVPVMVMAFEFYLSGYGKGIIYLLSLYLIVAVSEGILTIIVISFLQRVKPEIILE